jgi:hypothetical protein
MRALPRTVRAVRLLVVLLTTIGLALVGTGCSQSRSENAWCGLVKQHNEVFNATKPTPKALAAFGKIAAQAPPAIRADVMTVLNEVVHVAHSDLEYLRPARLNEFKKAKSRLDAYLKTGCGVTPPSTGQSA